jgi:nicotinamide-nucleotide amidase
LVGIQGSWAELVMSAAQELVAVLQQHGLWLAVAESITGGALSSEVVSAPGASKVFIGSIVAYQDALKSNLLGVSNALIQNQSSVDAEVAAQMAEQVRQKLAQSAGIEVSRVIGLATTGEAGPAANTSAAVGTVFIALAMPNGSSSSTRVFAYEFEGNRSQIRQAAVAAAQDRLRECLTTSAG